VPSYAPGRKPLRAQERTSMRTSDKISHLWRYPLTAAAALLLAPATQAQQAALTAGPQEIAGVVTSAKGPEAGVWVIAETSDFPSKLTKIVVTDDQGRYRIPELPKANYSVWVRGYGLVDSQK